ncbi:hypothetical protein DFJ73DRAFT_933825 [Zopfochytrium polystomum]|nr:hypothetical protein DFJ73DRAFT_933825 [Zopfochytrium polystomum]
MLPLATPGCVHTCALAASGSSGGSRFDLGPLSWGSSDGDSGPSKTGTSEKVDGVTVQLGSKVDRQGQFSNVYNAKHGSTDVIYKEEKPRTPLGSNEVAATKAAGQLISAEGGKMVQHKGRHRGARGLAQKAKEQPRGKAKGTVPKMEPIDWGAAKKISGTNTVEAAKKEDLGSISSSCRLFGFQFRAARSLYRRAACARRNSVKADNTKKSKTAGAIDTAGGKGAVTKTSARGGVQGQRRRRKQICWSWREGSDRRTRKRHDCQGCWQDSKRTSLSLSMRTPPGSSLLYMLGAVFFTQCLSTPTYLNLIDEAISDRAGFMSALASWGFLRLPRGRVIVKTAGRRVFLVGISDLPERRTLPIVVTVLAFEHLAYWHVAKSFERSTVAEDQTLLETVSRTVVAYMASVATKHDWGDTSTPTPSAIHCSSSQDFACDACICVHQPDILLNHRLAIHCSDVSALVGVAFFFIPDAGIAAVRGVRGAIRTTQREARDGAVGGGGGGGAPGRYRVQPRLRVDAGVARRRGAGGSRARRSFNFRPAADTEEDVSTVPSGGEGKLHVWFLIGVQSRVFFVREHFRRRAYIKGLFGGQECNMIGGG